MAGLPDSAPLSALSIPGTHDSLAVDAPPGLRTQDHGLAVQLRAGIRALDVRTRHLRDRFPIHHGPAYLGADFADVLAVCDGFLTAHPGETVLMRIAPEYTPAGNTGDYATTMDWYLHRPGPAAAVSARRLWRPPPGEPVRAPVLGAARGKIVLLQDFPYPAPLGIAWGGTATAIQDDFRPAGRCPRATKLAAVRALLAAARTGPETTLFINHLSMTAPRARLRPWHRPTPRDLALGAASAPGLVQATTALLRTGPPGRTGVMMADFPTAELVAAILARNRT